MAAFFKKPKHDIHSGQYKMLSEHTAVVDGPSVCLEVLQVALVDKFLSSFNNVLQLRGIPVVSLFFYFPKKDIKSFVSKQEIIRQLSTRCLQQHKLRIQLGLCQSLLDLLL